jgi:hypothetical protein
MTRSDWYLVIGTVVFLLLYCAFMAFVVFPPPAISAPLPFPKHGDRTPEGPWPVGRWQITVDRDGVPVHFTLQLNADKTGWVNHREPDRRKTLRWQRVTDLSGHWIEMRNGPDPSIPEAWDIGREWSIWIDGSDPATGKIAGGRMSIRRLP